MKRVQIVNHTHWDREWYFSTMDSLVLSDNIFIEIIDELKNKANTFFTLDGQISILEEFLELYPEKKADIKYLVENNQLFIGPWYTQTDAQLINGESIIRNLLIGIYETKKIAEPMKVGYLPDTFGFNAQMPTILLNSGINNIVFWRGIDYDQVKSPYFIWQGLSDKKILAINLPNGYGSIPRLYRDKEFWKRKIFSQEKLIREKTQIDEIVIPIGNDQNKITNNINDILNEINQNHDSEYISSNYPQFIEYLSNHKDRLEIYKGEFRTPKTGRVHKTIGSIRCDIKQYNFKLEEILIKRIEPLFVLANSLGIKISKNLLIKAWKKLLEGQAHDSIAGCVSDEVAVDILQRMKQVDELCASIENLLKKRIADEIDLQDDEIILFNLEGRRFKGYKDIVVLAKYPAIKIKDCINCCSYSVKKISGRKNVLVEGLYENFYTKEESYYEHKLNIEVDLPAFGYQVFKVEKDINQVNNIDCDLDISNEKYHIWVNNDKLNLAVNNLVVEDFIVFEDMGNDGDTYDFSPLRNDKPIYFRPIKGSRIINKLEEKLILTGIIMLPENLSDRLDGEHKREFNIILEIKLKKGNEAPIFAININNTVNSHRLRVILKTNIKANKSIASIPFGFLERDILNKEPEYWEEEYLENPIDIEVMNECVAIKDEHNCAIVYTKGIKEYQVEEDQIILTLFATTGELGKSDLLYRPGRASGDITKKGHIKIDTPKAQVKGNLQFEFMLDFPKSFEEREVVNKYNRYLSQNIYYQNQDFNKFLNRIDNKIQSKSLNRLVPKRYSLFDLGKLTISTIMPSLYFEDSYVIRIENKTNIKQKLDLNKLKNNFKLEFINAVEDVIEPISYINNYDFVQIRIRR